MKVIANFYDGQTFPIHNPKQFNTITDALMAFKDFHADLNRFDNYPDCYCDLQEAECDYPYARYWIGKRGGLVKECF